MSAVPGCSTMSSEPRSSPPSYSEAEKTSAERSPAQVVCLVSHGRSNKLVKVGGSQRLPDLRRSLEKTEFSGLFGAPLIIQMHNERFDCFVDLDEDSTIPDGAKIRLIGDGPSKEAAQPQASTTRVSCEPRIHNELLPVGHFTVPEFPIDIKIRVNRVVNGDVPDELRRRIVDLIFYSLTTRSMYPRRMYKVAAASLVARHYELRDSSTTGYDTWQMSIRNKFKNVRKRMPAGCPEVDAAKEKAKAIKLAVGANGSANAPFHRQIVVEAAFELEPAFVTEATDFMKKELKKSSPDMQKVDDAMRRTAPARRRQLVNENPALVEFLSIYPALMLEKQILNEFQLMTGVEPDKALLIFLREFADIILDLAKAKKSAQTTYVMLQAGIDAAGGFEKNYAKGVSALVLLPYLVNERGDDIFTALDPDKMYAHPTLVYTGCSPLASDAVKVVCEHVSIDVLDFTSGIALLFSMYWVYNLKFVKSAKQTLTVLQDLMGVKNSTSTSLFVTAAKLITTLRARAGRT